MLEAGERRRRKPIAGVRLVLISGARWPRRETVRLRALFPSARLFEFYGTSETSLVAWTESDPDLPDAVVGRPFANVELSIRDAAGPGAPGLVFVRSPMLFEGYVTGDDSSLLRDGDWVSVRDMGFLDGSGRLALSGRQRRMIVTAGRNLFPEEVEAVLEAHPSVAAASVLGVPDPVRGSSVRALVQPRGPFPSAHDRLAAHCRARLPAYKVPREFVVCTDWPRTASGKTDHARLAALHGQCRT